MNSADLESDFVKLLYSRGWNVEKIVRTHGLMAQSRACLGRVLKTDTGQEGFAKCIWEAGVTAGPDTQLLASPGRLKRLATRLETVRTFSQVPLVRLLDVAYVDDPKCLVIVMERVTPIADQLPGQPNDLLAASILRTFDPGNPGEGTWTHFDICPANTGTTSSGAPVLIDPESLYVITDEINVDVSCLAAKWYRSPREWWDAAILAAQEKRSFTDFSLHKHAYEVLLLAAEVSLGQAAPFPGGDGRAEDWLLQWFAQLEAYDHLQSRVVFWRTQLVAALDRRSHINFSAVGDALLACVARTEPEATSAALIEVALPESPNDLDRFAREMRADRLSEESLREYLKMLVTEGRRADSTKTWIEACLLCVCYLRDRKLALTIATEGSFRHSKDHVLSKWRQMIEMWAAQENS